MRNKPILRKNKHQTKNHLDVHNPFKPGADKPISQEDIDNEQQFKEAMTERD